MAQDDKTREPDELKKKLLRRAAVAGVLISALLGGLALFDYLMAPEPKPAAPSVPAAPPPQAEEKPAEEKKEEPKPEERKEEPAAEPEKTTTPLAPPPPAKPEAKPVPSKVEGPAPAKPAVKPTPPAAAKTPAPAAPPKPAETKPAALPAIPRGYVLQVGVFNNTANAEELRARLEAAGIPSTIEARVQLGPFKTRKEALVAQEKLKAASFGAGLLIPPKR